ncbi:MAG TPA: hypothetical protein VI522_07045 [Gammaproteobacteria bacterium]|nr:hypothetical protein [Gammaproteobacteria bacterium]
MIINVIDPIKKIIVGLEEPLKGHAAEPLRVELDRLLNALKGNIVEAKATEQQSLTISLCTLALGLEQAAILNSLKDLEEQHKQALALWLFYMFLYQLKANDSAKFIAVITARGYLRIG